MSSKSKGNKREREAQKLLEKAGWTVEKPVNTRFTSNKDFFHLFDRMAVKKDHPIIFVQVKSNGATGINKWMENVDNLIGLDNPAFKFYYFVPYDYEGWRIIKVNGETRKDVVDERKTSSEMGEETKQFFEQAD